MNALPEPEPAFCIVDGIGFTCDACGHQHTGEQFAFICIGCPCERRAPSGVALTHEFLSRIPWKNGRSPE